MQGNTSVETGPEIALRRALWAAGLRGYRKNVRKLAGRPDVVFGKAKLAVFVHGCFWHGCPVCTRNRTPKQNAAYWKAKVETNQARDVRNQIDLEAAGYRVLVVWECELKRDRLAASVERIRLALLASEEGPGTSPG
jgi:DNA mismatch endonuclease (patch repair protein)